MDSPSGLSSHASSSKRAASEMLQGREQKRRREATSRESAEDLARLNIFNKLDSDLPPSDPEEEEQSESAGEGVEDKDEGFRTVIKGMLAMGSEIASSEQQSHLPKVAENPLIEKSHPLNDRVLQNDAYEYRAIPKADISNCTVAFGEDLADQLGSLTPNDISQWFSVALRIDKGRHALPHIALVFRRATSPKEPMHTGREKTFCVCSIEYHVGVDTPEGKQFELNFIEAMPKDSYESLIEGEGHLIENGDWDRHVVLSFAGRCGRVSAHTSLPFHGFIQGLKNLPILEEKRLQIEQRMKTLFQSAGELILVSFLVRKSASEWLAEKDGWAGFQSMNDIGHKPYGYLYKNFGSGDLNVKNDDFPNIGQAGNRMLCQYTDQDQKSMQRQLQTHGQIKDWPTPNGFYHYPRQTCFNSLKEAQAVLQTSVLRGYQAEMSDNLYLANVKLPMIVTRPNVRRTLKSQKLGTVASRRSSVLLGYCFLVHSSADHIKAPEEDTAFKVSWHQEAQGNLIVQNTESQWDAYVAPLEHDEEGEKSGADFLLVMTPPEKDGVKPIVHDKFSDSAAKSYAWLTLQREDDTLEQTLDAIQDLCSPRQDELSDVRIPFIAAREPISVPRDIRIGQSMDQGPDIYETMLRNLKEVPPIADLNDEQIQFLESMDSVRNKLKLLLGGGGTRKTNTTAWLCWLLMAVGHKILLIAADHVSIDKFLAVMEETRVKAVEWQFGCYEPFMKDKKILRMVSDPFEKRSARKAASVVSRESKEDIKAFNSEMSSVFGHTVQEADMVATTYANAMHPTVRDNFKPTIAINVEASKTRVSTSCVTLSIPSVQLHLYVGNATQLDPFSKWKMFDEHSQTTHMSVLDWWLAKGFAPHWFVQQSRGHPDLFNWVNTAFYMGKLQHAQAAINVSADRQEIRDRFRGAVLEYHKTLKPDAKPSQLYFVNVNNGCSQTIEGSTSLCNWSEAEALVKLLVHLNESGIPIERIMVLPFYKGQKRAIQMIAGRHNLKDIPIRLVDNFQGEEAHITLVSLVSGSSEGTKGQLPVSTRAMEWPTSFGRSCKRVNVAMTRPKDGSVVFGCLAQLVGYERWNGKSGVFTSMYSYAENENILFNDETLSGIGAAVPKNSDEAAARSTAISQRAKEYEGLREDVRSQQQQMMSARKAQLLKVQRRQIDQYTGPEHGKALGSFNPDMFSEVVKRAERPETSGTSITQKKGKEKAAQGL